MMKNINFLGIKPYPLNKARFVILPLPYDQTVSYGRGTANGPQAILEASTQVELYDEELGQETCLKAPVHTIHNSGLNFAASPERFAKSLEDYAKKLLTQSAIHNPQFTFVGLGGEHSVSYPLIKAYKETLYPKLSILHLDAHSDLRDEYAETNVGKGSKYSHACVMRRVLDLKPKSIVQVGIRNLTSNCVRLIKQNKVKTFFAHHLSRIPNLASRILDTIATNDVYLTIDLDCFDPSVVPGVGTPEPGGLGWYEVLNILRPVFRAKNVVGIDVVELAPIKGSNISEFTAAKLIYRLMGYKISQSTKIP
ncbi:MAG: agmatinase [Planctomycetes bacterium]|nr:agmatinase [Planctomycetota bacterium]